MIHHCLSFLVTASSTSLDTLTYEFLELINMNDSVCREGNEQLTKLICVCEFGKIHAIIECQEDYLLYLAKIPNSNRPVLACRHYVLISLGDIEVSDEVSMAH